MSLSPRTVPVFVAAAAVLVLGACSTTTSGSPQRDGTGSATGTASAATLRSTLLRDGDLPSEWVSSAHDPSDDQDDSGDQALVNRLATCIGISVPDDSAEDAAKVYSPDFKDGQSEISSDSEPNSAAGTRAIKQLIASPKTGSCLEKALEAQLAKSLPSEAGTPAVHAAITGRATGQPSNVIGNFTAVVSLTVQTQQQPQHLTLYINDVDIESDAVQASIDFEGFATPIPSSVVSAATAAVSERVAKT